MRILFEQITKWQDSVFTKATPLSCVNHLEEELKELKDSIEASNIDKKEIADCFMLLFGVCNRAGFTYTDVINLIQEKFEIVQQRKWGNLNEKGYVKHINQ